jgi:cobalt/nickel transport system permease protein
MTLSFRPLPCPDSWLRPWDPRWKLAAISISIFAMAVLRSLPAASIGLVAALLLAWSARMPRKWYLSRIAPLGVFLGFFLVTFPLTTHDEEPLARIGGLAISWSGLRLALVIAAKAVSIMTLVLTLLIAAPLDRTLTAAHALGVPGLLIQVAILGYQYVFLLTSEMRRLRIAVRVRGYRVSNSIHCYRTIAHLCGALLVRSHEQAERVAQAMRCRGFDGRFRCLDDFRTRWLDVALFLCVTAVAVGLVVADLTLKVFMPY